MYFILYCYYSVLSRRRRVFSTKLSKRFTLYCRTSSRLINTTTSGFRTLRGSHNVYDALSYYFTVRKRIIRPHFRSKSRAATQTIFRNRVSLTWISILFIFIFLLSVTLSLSVAQLDDAFRCDIFSLGCVFTNILCLLVFFFLYFFDVHSRVKRHRR